VKKMLAISAVAMIAVAAGCSNKKSTAAGGVQVSPPPQPVHPVTQVAYAPEPVTPVVYEPAPLINGAGPLAGSTYTVQKGDTLWSISTRVYGDGKQYRRIVAANPAIRGESINIGQRITIPH
jgi:nucleoid-associated protein YgaU